MDPARYSSLPGIDRDNADVYETSDLPEDDQAHAGSYLPRPGVDTSESVERFNLSFMDAQSRFLPQAKLDEPKKQFPQLGFFPRSEYEILSGVGGETPVQRYDRLKAEVSEFIDSMEKASSAASDPNSAEDANSESVGVMCDNAKVLLAQLQQVHLDRVIRSEESVLDPSGSVAKRLASQIEALKNTHKAGEGEGKEGDVRGCTYEILVPSAPVEKTARYSELEKRICGLEKAVDVSGSATTGSETSLAASVERLEEKVFLLDKTNLELLESRLQSLLDKLKELRTTAKSTQGGMPSEKLGKVAELLEVTQKWDSVVDSLPSVTDRLAVLDSLHQQTLQFSQALNSLDTVQQQVAATARSNTTSLDQLRTSLTQNMDSIEASVSALGERVDRLKKA